MDWAQIFFIVAAVAGWAVAAVEVKRAGQYREMYEEEIDGHAKTIAALDEIATSVGTTADRLRNSVSNFPAR